VYIVDCLIRSPPLQLRPLIKPTKELLGIQNIDYKWPQIFERGTSASLLTIQKFVEQNFRLVYDFLCIGLFLMR